MGGEQGPTSPDAVGGRPRGGTDLGESDISRGEAKEQEYGVRL